MKNALDGFLGGSGFCYSSFGYSGFGYSGFCLWFLWFWLLLVLSAGFLDLFSILIICFEIMSLDICFY